MKTGIVGLGLIGGSAALALKRAGHAVYGLDADEAVQHAAQRADAMDAALSQDNLGEMDVLIIALYPRATVEYIKQNAPLIRKGAVVVDFCGVKRPVCAELEPLAAQYGFHYVGGHPMAGREKSGFGYADAQMFAGASLILTPAPDCAPGALAVLRALAKDMGFERVTLSTPEEHDRIIAYTSQLAHVLSSAYVKAPSALEHRGFSAGSFRDMTRVAWLNEQMWTELFLDNADYLAEETEALADRLLEYARVIRGKDADALCALLREGRLRKEMADG